MWFSIKLRGELTYGCYIEASSMDEALQVAIEKSKSESGTWIQAREPNIVSIDEIRSPSTHSIPLNQIDETLNQILHRDSV